MAKYYITHACGHVEVHDIGGPIKGRDWQETRLKERVCSDCYSKGLSDRASEQARQEGLPALVGSEKQVAWAETLRRKAIEWYEDRNHLMWVLRKIPVPANFTEGLTQEHHQAIAEALKERIIQMVSAQTSAKWFIDHRSADGIKILTSADFQDLAKAALDLKNKQPITQTEL
jgi:hypothetical protein